MLCHYRKIKQLNHAPSGSSAVEDIIFPFFHVEFLTESSTEHHFVGLCYVGGMKTSMAENNGFWLYLEQDKQYKKKVLYSTQ